MGNRGRRAHSTDQKSGLRRCLSVYFACVCAILLHHVLYAVGCCCHAPSRQTYALALNLGNLPACCLSLLAHVHYCCRKLYTTEKNCFQCVWGWGVGLKGPAGQAAGGQQGASRGPAGQHAHPCPRACCFSLLLTSAGNLTDTLPPIRLSPPLSTLVFR